MQTDSHVDRSASPEPRHPRRKLWHWIALVALIVAGGAALAGEWMWRRAGPILKTRIVETLSSRFNSRVELDEFSVSVRHGIDVSGRGLRIYPPDDVVAAGASAPLIAIREFRFHAAGRGLFLKPTHVGTVHVLGMTIRIPPRQQRQAAGTRGRRSRIQVVVDTLIFDDSRLVLVNSRPDKDPKTFELRHIELHNYGGSTPLSYRALLSNAIPRGDIVAAGSFGPWKTESPGDSPLTGHYTFDHADLSTIRGIAGTLQSAGDFSGQLDRIEVHGTTDTPDFALDTADHPMPLHTAFHAIVDGLSGDTYLEPVEARLGRSEFACRGAVVNVRGMGHIIDLDVNVPNGRMEDFLRLAVKTPQPIVTGRVQMRAKLNIPPGRESVMRKLRLHGAFTMRAIHFSNPATEDKIDELSLRALGHPKEAQPGADDVHSEMAGEFAMDMGRLTFSRLEYSMPGAAVELEGTYGLSGETIDFEGQIRTQAKLSQMVASRWKSWLLKPADPLFNKDGVGAVIPIRVSGTRDKPQFALDWKHREH